MEKDTKENLEQKIKRIILPVAAGISFGVSGLLGCGTTPHVVEKTTLYVVKNEVWYDCDTSEDYPSGHPCYDKVHEYHAAKRAASSSSSSSFSSNDYSIPGGDRPVRDAVDTPDTPGRGRWVCPTGN